MHPDDIAWVHGTEIGLGEELYLTRLPSGDTVQLVVTARVIWLVAVTSADTAASVRRVVVAGGTFDDEVERVLQVLTVAALLAPA